MFGDRLIRVAHHAFVILLVVAAGIALTAQTVVDPRYVEFTPSADHSALASDGTPLVQRYSLSVFVVGSSVAFDTMDLGKPTPSGGVIRVDFLPLLHSVPTPTVVFEARVAAIGPGGTTNSTVSNGFSFNAACAPSINSTGQSVGSGGATGSVGVTAGAGCAWSGVSNASWITLTGATSGSGNGTVPYSVAANTATAARSGTLTVAGQTYTVSQAGAPCTFAISSNSLSVAAAGGTGSTNVTSPTGCAWSAGSNNAWITVTSGATGSGNGSAGFSVAANTTTTARTGTLTIAGQTYTVSQAGAACTFAISSNSLSVAPAGGTGSTNVTSPTGCPWTAGSNNAWITVTSGATGGGNGSVGFSVAANTATSTRTGTLTVAGQTYTVTQAGAACTFAISSNSLSVAAAGGTGSTNVTSSTGCPWSAGSNNAWITVTSGATGSGNGSMGFSVAANTATIGRTGTLTVAGQTFTVNQAAAACTFTLTPTVRTVVAAGGTASTSVAAGSGCAWTAASNNGWLTLTSGGSGSGNGTVNFSASANTATQSRTATALIAGQTFTVTQNAAACTFSISPSSQSAAAAGANGSTTVTTTSGCAWTAESNVTWITVTAGASGSGSGPASFTIAPSTSTSQRTGTLTVAGRTFTVTQAANTCTYSLTPTSRTINGTGGTGTINVSVGAGCTWSASTTNSWISVSGSGTASGVASYTVQPNTATSARTGTISIGTQVFTITQASGAATPPVAPRGLRITAVGG